MITRKKVKAFTNKLILICAAMFLFLNHPVYGIYSLDDSKTKEVLQPPETREHSSIYNDVNENQWFYREVSRAYESGIIGRKSLYFRPYDNITAAEFIKIMTVLDGFKESSSKPWYLDYVNHAVKMSWFTHDAVYDFERPITKLEAAQIICGFLKLDTEAPASNQEIYTDTDSKYALALYRESLIVPYAFKDGRHFSPSSPLTRAEAVVLAVKAADYKKSPLEYKTDTLQTKTTGIRLPILLYHNIGNQPSDWGPMTIPPEKFKEDIEAVLKSGYTPVLFDEVLAFVDGYAELPDNPVIITFDDGYKGVYDYAFPIMKELKVKSSNFIVGSTVGDPEFNIRYRTQHLNDKTIKEMFDSGLVEFQNHSYDMHRDGGNLFAQGIGKYYSESAADYRYRLSTDTLSNSNLIRRLTGVVPDVFAYPMGIYTAESEDILKYNGYRATLSTIKGVNILNDGLYAMKRITASYNIPSSRIVEMISE